MTGIAAISHKGRVYMAGDSAATCDNHYSDLVAIPKVFHVGPLLIGYTSSFRLGYALQYRFQVPVSVRSAHDLPALDRAMCVDMVDAVRSMCRDIGYIKKDAEREYGGTFLVGYRGHIWTFDDDFHARRTLHDLAACGSGMSVIQGALYANREDEPHVRLIKSLEAAEIFVATVRRPFTVAVEPGDEGRAS